MAKRSDTPELSSCFLVLGAGGNQKCTAAEIPDSVGTSNPPAEAHTNALAAKKLEIDNEYVELAHTSLTCASTTGTCSQDNAYPSYVAPVGADFNIQTVLDCKPKKGMVLLVKKTAYPDLGPTVLKVFPKTDLKALDRRRHEANMHSAASKARHPHIARFLQSYDYDTAFCVEMQHCDLRDLTHLSRDISAFQRLELVRQIASALRHLHDDLSMVHIDIKPANVALSVLSNGQLIARLIDFGSAQPDGRWRRQGRPFGGTSHYKAPETFAGGPNVNGKFFLGEANDMWGLGIIVIFLFTGKLPWNLADSHDDNFQAFREHMKRRELGSSEVFPIAGITKLLPSVIRKHLIPGLLHPYPEHRYSAAMIENVLEQYLLTKNSISRIVDGIKVFDTSRRSAHRCATTPLSRQTAATI